MGVIGNVLGWWRRLWAPAVFEEPVRPARTQGVSASPAQRPASASPNDVFTPTRPRAGRRTLVGRQAELQRILDGIFDDTAHVVLYSERGRGKTSLSNLSIEQLRRRGAIVARCACEAETTFDTMIRALARDLPPSLLVQGGADSEGEGCESLLPPRSVRPADVAAIPAGLGCDATVFVVDEFDRVTDLETRTRLADTIKLLSDRGLRLYFMVVGVSDTLEQIIGQHPSIQRNIVGVHLPLLRDDEIADMLTKGGQQAGIAFSEAAVQTVQGVARGMPYMAQLLGLRIAQSALRRAEGDDAQVAESDMLGAVQRLLEEAGSAVTMTYATLCAEPRMQGLLLRLAGAEQDRWGRMAFGRVAEQVVVGGARMAPAQWQRLLECGVVAQPDGEFGPVQFRDRPLIYHILLLAARKALTARTPGSGESPSEPEQLQMASGA